MDNQDLYFPPENEPVRKKRNGWKYFLCLVSGMIFGVTATVGSVVFASTKVSTSQIVTAFGQDPNAVLNKKYQNESLYSFILSVVNKDTDLTSIRGISEVTPLVTQVIDSLGGTLEKYLGVTLTVDDIIVLDFEQVPDFLFNKMKREAKIAVILDINENSDNLLKLLAFHKNEDGTFDYNSPRQLSEFTESKSEEGGSIIGGTESIVSELINDAKVSDVIEVHEGDLLYPFKDTKIADLQEEIRNTPINKLIVFNDDTPAILKALGNYTFNNIAEGITSLTVMDVFGKDTYDQQNPLIRALFNSRICDLSTAVGNLPLSSFINLNDDLPYALERIINKTKIDPITGEERPYTIDELIECYEHLTIGDALDFNDPEIANNKFLRCINPNTLLSDLPNAFNNITLGALFHNDIYEGDKVKLLWEYLLHNPDVDAPLDSDASDEEKFSGLGMKLDEDFNMLLNNMSKNTVKATIRQLYSHGLLDLQDPSVLDKHVIGDTKKVGDYTYTEFIARIANSGLLVD